MSDLPSKSTNNPVQNEYENIKDYHKWIVNQTKWFVLLITGIGVLVFAYDRNELKNQLLSIENKAKKEIENIKEITEVEKELIKKEVADIARKEIIVQLAYYFEEGNVSNLIDSKVEKEIKSRASALIDVEVRQAKDDLVNELTEMGKIADSAIRMRIGHADGRKLLFNYSKKSRYTTNRARAKELYNQIMKDYQDALKSNQKSTEEQSGWINLKETFMVRLGIQNDSLLTNKLVDYILKDDTHLWDVSDAIMLLNKTENTNFNALDFNQIKEWKEEDQKGKE